MTKTAHTPGPWALVQEDKWPWGLRIDPGVAELRRIAHSTAHKSLDDVRSAAGFDDRQKVAGMVATQEANARLIAAAPDLLEALVEAQIALDLAKCTFSEFGSVRPEVNIALAQVRAAIDKAKGGAA